MANDYTLTHTAPIPSDVQELADLIRAMLPNGAKLSEQEAIAGAMYGKVHGLSPFKGEYYIVPGKGIYPGYRGEMKLREDREFYTQTRPLNGDEVTEHEIAPGDSARAVELFLPDLMAKMRALGVPYRPIVGIGIVRKAEKFTATKWVNGQRVTLANPEPIDPPMGRSWSWKAEQRALKDALRHMQGDIDDSTPDERLAAADERAQAVVAEFHALPATDQQARLAANVTLMRGAKTDDPLGIDAPPEAAPTPPGNSHAPEPDITYEDLLSASQERSAQAIRETLWQSANQEPAKAHPEMRLKFKQNLAIAIGTTEERHALTAWLFGSDNPEDWTQGQCRAANAWFNVGKAGDGYAPAEKFLTDWKIIKAAILPAPEPVGK